MESSSDCVKQLDEVDYIEPKPNGRYQIAVDPAAPDYIELEEEQIEVLTGLRHLCPLCFSVLSHRLMPVQGEEHWYCKVCGTEWDVGDLIASTNYNELGGNDGDKGDDSISP